MTFLGWTVELAHRMADGTSRDPAGSTVFLPTLFLRMEGTCPLLIPPGTQ